MSPENLPFNWFDVLLLIVLIIGLKQGRKHGMSEELIGMLMWIAIALGCAVAYRPIGEMITQNSVFSLLSGYLMAYVGIALLITVVFTCGAFWVENFSAATCSAKRSSISACWAGWFVSVVS
jgi:hypothetical protein